MEFTYRELERLTGIAYHTLRQWRSFGHIDADGDGSGTKNDPATFTEETAYRLLWLVTLTSLQVPLERALSLWDEAQTEESILVITPNGTRWLNINTAHKKLKTWVEDDPAFTIVSVPHFMAKAKADLADFKRIDKFRNKVGLEDSARLAVVH